MKILYDREYKEVNTTNFPKWEDKIKSQQEHYQKWEGKVYGDFKIVKLEYDWFLKQQRALLKCVHCGLLKYSYDPKHFRKGTGSSQTCKCQKIKKTPKSKERTLHYDKYIGEEINGFVALDYVTNKGMLVCCANCMKEQWVFGKNFVEGNTTCNHKLDSKYEVNLIGKKFGDLTVIKRQGYKYLCRCECGAKETVDGFDLVNSIVHTCGRAECEFFKKRKKDIELDYGFQEIFKDEGYEIIRMPESHEYGVDFIAVINGEKWAFQYKPQQDSTDFKSVLEVYAGGKLYDCTHYCVISPSSFTVNAIKCAAKLGVQLARSEFVFNMKLADNVEGLSGLDNE